MPSSEVIDWLDENSLRMYPLQANNAIAVNGTRLTPEELLLFEKTILDASLTFGVSITNINLNSIQKVGDTVFIQISSNPTFTVEDYINAEYPYYARNSTGSLLVIGSGLVDLITTIGDVQTYTNAVFEPSVCFELIEQWRGVNQIQFLNNDDETIKTLDGIIEFVEGFQFRIDINEETNTISLGVGRNYGLPIDCTKFFDIPDDCDDIISYINSVTTLDNPGTFRFFAGDNIAIYEDPANHRIYVGLNFDIDNICVPVLPGVSPNVL